MRTHPGFHLHPPYGCVKDYKNHPWKEAFSPTEGETREEATKQLETLEYFRVYRLQDRTRVGLWNGVKDFRSKDPSNYLEMNHKAPPAEVFREDQDSSYTREEAQQVGSTTFGPRSHHTLKILLRISQVLVKSMPFL